MSSEDERRNQNGNQQQMSLIDYTQQRLHIARDTALDIEKEIEAVNILVFKFYNFFTFQLFVDSPNSFAATGSIVERARRKFGRFGGSIANREG